MSSLYILQSPSVEQQKVIDSYRKTPKVNITIHAVAGAGKTTTLLHLAKVNPQERILLITYNAKLKRETRQKVQQLQLHNIEVHSYHAVATKYYGCMSYQDAGIWELISGSIPPKQRLNWTSIFIDEVQDMTPLYFQFVMKLQKDLGQNVRWVLCGDERQCIYQFNDADSRFLRFGSGLFPSSFVWEEMFLSVSYRCTGQMARVVHCLDRSIPIEGFSDDRGVSSSLEPSVHYIQMHTQESRFIHEQIMRYLREGYRPDDIFICSPSVRKGSQSSPLRILEKRLLRDRVPVYIPIQDEETLSETTTHGKLCFATFHQVKGLERKIVFLYHFDNSFFQFYDRTSNTMRYPNIWYVAMTRAIDHVWLIHDVRHPALPFVQLVYEKFLETVGSGVEKSKLYTPTRPRASTFEWSVTELLRNCPVERLAKAMKPLTFIRYTDDVSFSYDDIPTSVTLENGLVESVSELTGVAVPALFEYYETGESSIMNAILQMSDKIPEQYKISLKASYERYQKETWTHADALFTANILQCLRSGYWSKCQVLHGKYIWLDGVDLAPLFKRLEALMGYEGTFEFQVYLGRNALTDMIPIRGVIDAMTPGHIWEFKTTRDLVPDSALQLAVYAWMYEKCYPDWEPECDDAFQLVHLWSGERYVLDWANSDLDAMIDGLREVPPKHYTDEEFHEWVFRPPFETTFNSFITIDTPVTKDDISWLTS